MADAMILYVFNFDRPLHSMEIEYWFSQINSLVSVDHISKIRLN